MQEYYKPGYFLIADAQSFPSLLHLQATDIIGGLKNNYDIFRIM